MKGKIKNQSLFKNIVSRIILITLLKIKVFFYRFFLSNASPFLYKSIVSQAVMYSGKGRIYLNEMSIGIHSSPNVLDSSSYLEAKHQEAIIKIGKNTVINNNATIISDRAMIEIGENCLIGPNFFCCDSDFHCLEASIRRSGEHKSLPVRIGNNVFIGEGVRILKGVNVGDNTVIGSGSIVINNLDKNSIYAGNPAKLIRKIVVDSTQV